jgi:hypothetical protein
VTDSKALNTIKKDSNELDKMQKLLISQKPTESKLNNSIKAAEKNDKENVNPNIYSNENVNIKDQNVIFFKKGEKENLNLIEAGNNKNLIPKNIQLNINFVSEDKRILNNFYYEESQDERFKAEKNTYFNNHNRIDTADSKLSYYNNDSENFDDFKTKSVVNDNTYYQRHNHNGNYYKNQGCFPKYQYYKKSKKAIMSSNEWDRLWESSQRPNNKNFKNKANI